MFCIRINNAMRGAKAAGTGKNKKCYEPHAASEAMSHKRERKRANRKQKKEEKRQMKKIRREKAKRKKQKWKERTQKRKQRRQQCAAEQGAALSDAMLNMQI